MAEEWDYNVVIKELQTHEVPGDQDHPGREADILQPRVATVDEASGRILGTVSRKYNLVTNRLVHDTINEVVGELGLNLDAVSVVKDKRATIFRYMFGEDRLKTVTNSIEPQDKVQFGVEVINSFDSSLGGSRFQAFANRLVCTNGLTIPREVGRFSFRDLGVFTSTVIKDRLFDKIDPIMNTADTWNQWAQITPTEAKVSEFVAEHYSRKVKEMLLEEYNKLKDKSIYGIYNMLTYYNTHQAKCRITGDLRMKQYNLDKVVNKFYKMSWN